MSESVSTTRITTRLPPEILLQCFSYLEDTELHNVSTTCKSLRAVVVPQIYRKFGLNIGGRFLYNKLTALSDSDSPASIAAESTQHLEICINRIDIVHKEQNRSIQGAPWYEQRTQKEKAELLRTLLPVAIKRFKNVTELDIQDYTRQRMYEKNFDASTIIPTWVDEAVKKGCRRMRLRKIKLVYWLQRDAPVWIAGQKQLEDVTIIADDLKDGKLGSAFFAAMQEVLRYPRSIRRLHIELPYCENKVHGGPSTSLNPSGLVPKIPQESTSGDTVEQHGSNNNEAVLNLNHFAANIWQLSPGFLRSFAPHMRNLTSLEIPNGKTPNAPRFMVFHELGIRLKKINSAVLDRSLIQYLASYSNTLEEIQARPANFGAWRSELTSNDRVEPEEFLSALLKHKASLRIIKGNCQYNLNWGYSRKLTESFHQFTNLEDFHFACDKRGFQRLLTDISTGTNVNSLRKLKTLRIGLLIGYHPCGNGMWWASNQVMQTHKKSLTQFRVPKSFPVQKILLGDYEKHFRKGEGFVKFSCKEKEGEEQLAQEWGDGWSESEPAEEYEDGYE